MNVLFYFGFFVIILKVVLQINKTAGKRQQFEVQVEAWASNAIVKRYTLHVLMQKMIIILCSKRKEQLGMKVLAFHRSRCLAVGRYFRRKQGSD